MENFKLESETVGQVQPKVEPKPEFKFLWVDVTKKLSSAVILQVPYEYNTKQLWHDYELLASASKTTLDRCDWEDNGFDCDYECEGVKEISQAEATKYRIFKIES